MATGEDYQGTNIIIKPRGAAASTGSASGVDTGNAAPWTVFLSSTIGDLAGYREQLQQVMLKRARAVCFLSEDWINTYGSTVKKCQEELEKANSFIGVFGYWYGSIPPGYKQSITHLEFSWALKKWSGDKEKPIAILMPKSPSAAERRLTKSAAALIPAGKLTEKKHSDLLKAFRDEVTTTWNSVILFETIRDLREQVIVVCLQWRLGRPMDAATGAVQVIERSAPQRTVTDEEWGLLGRQDQIEAFDKILNRVALFNEVPAVAMLVHGDEDAGQRVFLRQLITRKKFRSGRPVQPGRPQLDQYDTKVLTQWVGESLGVLSPGKETASPEELAELIHEELQSQQLIFVLDQVSRLSGGVKAWHAQFWQPLYRRLAELRKQKPAPHRLVAVIVDYVNYDAAPGLDEKIARQFSKTAKADDYPRIWMIPALNVISSGELMDWFDSLDVPDGAAGNRAKLANLALKNSRGDDDGTPLRVFDRLANSNLWKDGEKS